MSDVFRIIDRFTVTGRGRVYMLKHSKGAKVCTEDTLFDLHGNRFVVTGIEMIRRCWDGMPPFDELPVGIMVRLEDGIEAQGNLLFSEPPKVNFLFCNHPLYPRRVDESYEEEYLVAQQKHKCALFSYEDFVEGTLTLHGDEIAGLTIYRGWMMSPERYRALFEALEQREIFLINTPEEYAQYHLLPNWYDDFKGVTAESVWTVGCEIDEALRLSKQLSGSYIVKDYVKSRKHEWYDACYIKNIKDTKNLETVLRNFVVRQGEDLAGGVVLRKFESLKQIGYHNQSGMPLSEEYRVFVYGGRILGIINYWTDKTLVKISADEYKWIENLAKRIQSNFVAMDVARREDGMLLVMELGDGQVSGLQKMKAEEFYRGFEGLDFLNPYTIAEIKQALTTYIQLDILPEMSLYFRDKEDEYVFSGYTGHISFQRCGSGNYSEEVEHPDIDSFFSAELIDGIQLERDWYKVEAADCRPEIDDVDFVIEAYRVAAEGRNETLGDRYRIYQIVKKEIEKWNPYNLLPGIKKNELYNECEELALRIKYTNETKAIAKKVARVFCEVYETEIFTIDMCMDVAARIREGMDKEWKKGADLT